MSDKLPKDHSIRRLDDHYIDVSNDLLIAKYNAHVQYFVNDNGRIWVSASIFLSSSILILAFTTTNPDILIQSKILMFFASAILLFSWYFVAEQHKMFQEKHDEIINCIEDFHLGNLKQITYRSSKSTLIAR